MASSNVLILNASTVPKPSIDPIHPPKNAPAIPINMVIMQPPGSLPGRIHLAMAPANKPKMIHDDFLLLNYLVEE